MKFKLILATLMFAMSSVVMAGGAQDAISAAKAAQKQAKSVGFEWRDMGKLIKKAEAAAKDGKDKKAIKLANTVVKQGKEAVLQAKVAKTAGPRF